MMIRRYKEIRSVRNISVKVSIPGFLYILTFLLDELLYIIRKCIRF